jgi:hypothetical protein
LVLAMTTRFCRWDGKSEAASLVQITARIRIFGVIAITGPHFRHVR